MSRKTKAQQQGQRGEALAAAYLTAQGLRIVAKNQHCRYGELDLIAWHGAVLVFVEVRQRRAGAMVSAAASITPAKQEKLRLSALHYLQQQHAEALPDCRFDAICIDGETITWLQNIIQA